jgi:hypothetical protein
MSLLSGSGFFSIFLTNLLWGFAVNCFFVCLHKLIECFNLHSCTIVYTRIYIHITNWVLTHVYDTVCNRVNTMYSKTF